MNINYIFGPKIIEEYQIKEFLEKTDKEFNPKLSSKVNIPEYSEKLFNNAILIVAESDNHNYVGLTAFYANDYTNKTAYLSNINVMQEYSGLGIGKSMMKKMGQYLIDKGFKSIFLEVYKSNYTAIKLYEKFDFTIESEKNSFYVMKKLVL